MKQEIYIFEVKVDRAILKKKIKIKLLNNKQFTKKIKIKMHENSSINHAEIYYMYKIT